MDTDKICKNKKNAGKNTNWDERERERETGGGVCVCVWKKKSSKFMVPINFR